MDGRESTATSGPNYSPFYVQHRGMGSPGAAGHPGGFHGPPPGGYRQQLDAVSAGYAFQQQPFGTPAHIGQGFHQNHVDASPHLVQHNAGGGGGGSADVGMGAPVSADAKGDQGSEAGQDGQGKKKRGRPRKYKPDGSVTALGLSSPSPSTPHSSSSGMGTMVATPGSGFGPGAIVATPGSGLGPGTGSGGSGSGALTEKRGRGRPPGSGKMQQLASLGKWFLGSVGTGFTPHVIIISAGEDIHARIMSFSQQGPRAICIISATGAVSTATLQQDSDSGAVTYEGRFEILCLSGSYLLLEEGGTRTRSGGLCIALCGPDHRVIGGSVGGVLTAAGTVQVIVGSFMYGGGSKKSKAKAEQGVENEEQNGGGGGEDTPTMALPDHNMPPNPMSGWPPGMMNQMDSSSQMYGDPNKSQAKAEQDMENEEHNRGGGGEEPLAMAPPEHNMNMPPHHLMGGWAPASLMRQMDSRSSNIDINSIRE
uniref:Uncharacterized protein n=1 Tax=Avena sativa TaxID=4498 RepID=A0ACD5YWH0_AVESA